TERATPQFGHPGGIVHEQHVLVGGRWGLDEIVRPGETGIEKPVAQPAILPGGKNVIAEVQIVLIGIDEPQGAISARTEAPLRPPHYRCPPPSSRARGHWPAWRDLVRTVRWP